tara:strand:+ start:248 stop:2062 length:1815 start_codon:yes stop_codon:yes gene_type:complete
LLVDKDTNSSDAFWNNHNENDAVSLQVEDYRDVAGAKYCFNVLKPFTPLATYDFAVFNFEDISAPGSEIRRISNGEAIPTDEMPWPLFRDDAVLNKLKDDILNSAPSTKDDLPTSSTPGNDGASFKGYKPGCAACQEQSPPEVSIILRSESTTGEDPIAHSHVFKLEDYDDDDPCPRAPEAGYPSDQKELTEDDTTPIITAIIANQNSQDLAVARYNQYRIQFRTRALLYLSATDTSPIDICPNSQPDYHEVINITRQGIKGATPPDSRHVLSGFPDEESTIYNVPELHPHEQATMQIDLSHAGATSNKGKKMFADPKNGHWGKMSATAYFVYGLWAKVELPDVCKDLNEDGSVKEDGWNDAKLFGDVEGISDIDKMPSIKSGRFSLNGGIAMKSEKTSSAKGGTNVKGGVITFPENKGTESTTPGRFDAPVKYGPVNFYAQDGTYHNILLQFGVSNSGPGKLRALMKSWNIKVKAPGSETYVLLGAKSLVKPSTAFTTPFKNGSWWSLRNPAGIPMDSFLDAVNGSSPAFTKPCVIDINGIINNKGGYERGDYLLTMNFVLANAGYVTKAPHETFIDNIVLECSWNMPSTLYKPKSASFKKKA